MIKLLNNKFTAIALNDVASGMYIVTVLNDGVLVKTAKIIKK